MKLAFVVAGLAAAASSASAEMLRFGGHFFYDVRTQSAWRDDAYSGSATDLPGDVYNNTNPSAGANFGFSSTSFTASWGDRVTTTGTGILDQNDFTVYNATAAGGASLLTASFNVKLYNAAGGTLPGGGAPLMGAYTTGTVNFGAGLAPGFFSTITITGVGFLGINLTTTDVLMTTQVNAFTGAVTSLGIASLGTNNPSVGSAGANPSPMYINAATVGAEGYYNIGTPALNANPGMRINIPAPGSLALLGLGGLFAARRRRS